MAQKLTGFGDNATRRRCVASRTVDHSGSLQRTVGAKDVERFCLFFLRRAQHFKPFQTITGDGPYVSTTDFNDFGHGS